MTAQQAQQWVAAAQALVALGAPIAALVKFLREALAPADADAVLRQLLGGWEAAEAENAARIAELRAHVTP